MVDRHRPIVARDVPVELIVILEVADAVLDHVVDLNRARGVHRIGNVDLQVAEAARNARIVLQLVAAAIGDAGDVEEKRVVGATWSGIFDGNEAMNSVPLAYEYQSDALIHDGAAVALDSDRVLEVGDSPALGGDGCGEPDRGR